MPHGERAGIAIGGEPVVSAAVNLHLVLVEAVPQIASGHAEREIEPLRVIDRKGRIGQVLGLGLGHGRLGALSRQPAPNRRQLLERRSIAIALCVLLRRDPGEAVSARKRAVEIVEAAVLGVDHDDVLNALDPRAAGRLGQAGNRRRQHRHDQNEWFHDSPEHP